jgi:hypothetical protein
MKEAQVDQRSVVQIQPDHIPIPDLNVHNTVVLAPVNNFIRIDKDLNFEGL